MFNSSSEGNLHKGYVEANDPPSLNSESSYLMISVEPLCVCVSVCTYISAYTCCTSNFSLNFVYMCVCVCRLVEWTWMVRARKKWWHCSEPPPWVGLWPCWWLAKRTLCCPEKWSVSNCFNCSFDPSTSLSVTFSALQILTYSFLLGNRIIVEFLNVLTGCSPPKDLLFKMPTKCNDFRSYLKAPMNATSCSSTTSAPDK